MISRLLSSTKPIATADRPAYAFKIEITVGMSAPPIGMTSIQPKFSARMMISTNSDRRPDSDPASESAAHPAARPGRMAEKLTMFWPLYSHGRCGIHLISCSFPAAIRLPVNVR